MRRIITLLLLAPLALPAIASAQEAPAEQSPAPQAPAQQETAPPPTVPTPEQAAASVETRPAGPILTLDEAVKAVRESNPDLAAARARLVAADQASRKAWSGYLPQAQVQANYQHNSTSASLAFPNFAAGFTVAPDGTVQFNEIDQIDIQKADQLGAQATVSQAVFAAPLIPAIQSAYTAEEIAKLSTDQVEIELVFGAAQAYFGAVGLKEAIGISRQQLDLVKEHLRTAEAAFQAGTVPKLAVLRARIDVSQAEQDLTRSLNGYAAARGALAVLMGRKDIDFEVASFSQEPDHLASRFAEMPSYDLMLDRAFVERPDVQIADLNLRLSKESKLGVWAQFLPTLGAAWNWRWSDVQGFTGKYANWTVMVTASWNLFDGGLRYAQLNEAQANILAAEHGITSTKIRITQEVRQSRLDIASARANLEKAQEQVRLANANWAATEKAFNVGAASSVDVTDAVSARRTAEIATITEAVNLRVAEVRLQKAIGMTAPAEALPAMGPAAESK